MIKHLTVILVTSTVLTCQKICSADTLKKFFKIIGFRIAFNYFTVTTFFLLITGAIQF